MRRLENLIEIESDEDIFTLMLRKGGGIYCLWVGLEWTCGGYAAGVAGGEWGGKKVWRTWEWTVRSKGGDLAFLKGWV